MALGLIAIDLGAGRTRADQAVDHAVGIELLAQRGQQVERGQELAIIHARRSADAERVAERCRGAIRVGVGRLLQGKLVLERVDE